MTRAAPRSGSMAPGSRARLVCQLRRAGYPIKEIAEKTDLSVGGVDWILQRARARGVDVGSGKKNPPAQMAEHDALVAPLFLQNLSGAAIHRQTGLSPHYVKASILRLKEKGFGLPAAQDLPSAAQEPVSPDDTQDDSQDDTDVKQQRADALNRVRACAAHLADLKSAYGTPENAGLQPEMRPKARARAALLRPSYSNWGIDLATGTIA